MRHLTPDDYRRMPWANGRGVTLEMARADGPDGLLWRLSLASVVEDGPFSLFPGVERNLTVISGPGFDLTGALNLRADPLLPVAFPGNVELSAANVTEPCDDLNLMTARNLPRPRVWLAAPGEVIAPPGLIGVLALDPMAVNGRPLGRRDLCLDTGALALSGAGRALAIRLIL